MGRQVIIELLINPSSAAHTDSCILNTQVVSEQVHMYVTMYILYYIAYKHKQQRRVTTSVVLGS